MKTALFTNFSIEEFIGYWNGKPKKFAPGAETKVEAAPEADAEAEEKTSKKK